ncbi:MAG TPA: hypothetical protein VJQ48_12900, partial [Candidatus Binatia bacterium]|nr:hypothetical protein [Candidatus Binatia bacterium]
YVLNRLESGVPLAAETNREALSTLTAVRCAGELPFVAASEDAYNKAAYSFAEQFDLRIIDSVLCERPLR